MFRVVKRDGEVNDFTINKISDAIIKAFNATEVQFNNDIVDLLSLRVVADFQPKVKDGAIHVEDIQDSVEKTLEQAGFAEAAKAFILYRKQREKMRNMKSTILDYKDVSENDREYVVLKNNKHKVMFDVEVFKNEAEVYQKRKETLLTQYGVNFSEEEKQILNSYVFNGRCHIKSVAVLNKIRSVLEKLEQGLMKKHNFMFVNINDVDIVQRFNVDLSDIEVEILTNYLLIELLDSEYIRVPSLLKISLPSSDFKAFSKANLIDKLMAMHKTYVTENETLLSRYAWMGAKESGVKLGAGYKKNKNF